MYRRIQAIALKTVKYSDKNSILTVWTADSGRMSLLISDSAGRESRRRRALTMPMSVLECEVDMRAGREVLPVREMRASMVTPSVSANPVKASIAMFMAEVVLTVFRDTAASDAVTWHLLTQAVAMLDKTSSSAALANFPLWFMARMAVAGGIEPDTSGARTGWVFDMTEGIFRPAPPAGGVWLGGDQARLAAMLTRLPARHLSLLRISGTVRREALDMTIRYFGMHHLPLTSLKSLPVLHALLR